MSEASTKIEGRIFARDQSVSGPLRLTLPISFATDLLMETLTDFRSSYPDIALEIIGTGTVANLSNREADVALRVVLGDGSPPDNLYGSRLCAFSTAYYARRLDRTKGIAPPLAWLLGPARMFRATGHLETASDQPRVLSAFRKCGRDYTQHAPAWG